MNAVGQPARRSIESLTGIRGIAAVWVLSYHVSLGVAPYLLHWPALEHNPLFSTGWAGVDLFFVLSGFILMYAHANDFQRVTRSQIAKFAIQRGLRVYPLNWCVLGLIVVASSLDPAYWVRLQDWAIEGQVPQAFARTALLGTEWLPGQGSFNEPTWSLSAEIIGYIYFPVLALRLNTASRFRTLILVATVSLALQFDLQWLRGTLNANDTASGMALTRMASCFVAGAALARARMVAPASVSRHAGAISIAAVTIILIALLVLHMAALLPACFAGLIFALSYEIGPVDRLCRSRPIMFLGRVSFSLYLIHTQLLAWMEVHQPSSPPAWPFGLAMLVGYSVAVLLLSWLLYRCVERPAHRLARAWIAHLQPSLSPME